MAPALVNLAYLAAAVLFIFGLKGLSHPRTAVRANLTGATLVAHIRRPDGKPGPRLTGELYAGFAPPAAWGVAPTPEDVAAATGSAAPGARR